MSFHLIVGDELKIRVHGKQKTIIILLRNHDSRLSKEITFHEEKNIISLNDIILSTHFYC